MEEDDFNFKRRQHQDVWSMPLACRWRQSYFSKMFWLKTMECGRRNRNSSVVLLEHAEPSSGCWHAF